MNSAVLIAFVTSVVSVFGLMRFGGVRLPVDSPNERSLHVGDIPRVGGGGIVVAVSAGMWGAFPGAQIAPYSGVLLGATVLVLVSLWDDFGHVAPLVRLFVQGGAASLLVSSQSGCSELWACAGLSVLIIWLINLYNFMDGMDGLAGSMAVCGFGALGILGYLDQNEQYATIMFIIAGASAGFLVFNLPPARIFMGDVGSTFLGYMVAAASIQGVVDEIFPWWAPVLIFLPFWLDATITLLRRLFRGERIWEAHRSHFYQRAVLAGMPVRRVLLVEVLFMLVCSAAAIISVMLLTNGN